ncbi:hypothetical protein [Paenibacillus abyssi]|nr:hypothetical protein [Paenibacillus abyssi]
MNQKKEAYIFPLQPDTNSEEQKNAARMQPHLFFCMVEPRASMSPGLIAAGGETGLLCAITDMRDAYDAKSR